MDLTPAAPVKLGFSLKQKPKTNATVIQQPAASPFLSLDDDEPRIVEPTKASRRAPARLVATEASMSKSLRNQLEEQRKTDPHAFEYDEVWDRMKDAERQAQLAKEEEAKIRKV
jgi:coiled-coil domain-containing protein 55